MFQHAIFLDISILSALISATCYLPDGTTTLGSGYQPCRNTTYSMCCTSSMVELQSGTTFDDCLPNGLCSTMQLLDDGSYSQTGNYTRGTCTDQRWESAYCLNACTNSTDSQNGSGSDSVRLTQCHQDDSWCCGGMSSDDCCERKDRFALPATLGTQSTTTPGITATTVTANQPSVTTTENTQHSEQGERKRVALGLGVGVGLGIPVLAILVAALYMRYRLVKTRSTIRDTAQLKFEKPEIEDTVISHDIVSQNAVELPAVCLAEVEDSRKVVETDGIGMYELESGGVHELAAEEASGRRRYER